MIGTSSRVRPGATVVPRRLVGSLFLICSFPFLSIPSRLSLSLSHFLLSFLSSSILSTSIARYLSLPTKSCSQVLIIDILVLVCDIWVLKSNAQVSVGVPRRHATRSAHDKYEWGNDVEGSQPMSDRGTSVLSLSLCPDFSVKYGDRQDEDDSHQDTIYRSCSEE